MKNKKTPHGVQMNSVIRAVMLLEVLKRGTDTDHPVTQTELKKAAEKFGVVCTEKTLRTDLKNLMQALNPPETEYEFDPSEFKLVYDGIGEFRYHKTGIKYIHKFSNEELELLIELVKGSEDLSEKASESLINRISSLGSGHYEYHSGAIKTPSRYSTIDKTFLRQNLFVINAAIAHNKRMSFTFNKYTRDGKLSPVRTRKYIVNPYYVIIYGQKYYLLATHGEHKDVHIYRLDLMTDAELCDEKRSPIREVDELSHSSVKEYMERHPDGTYEKPRTIALRVKNDFGYNAVRDKFGDNYTVKKTGEVWDEIEVYASPSSVINWIFPYIDRAEIIRPKGVRDMLIKKAEEIKKIYS